MRMLFLENWFFSKYFIVSSFKSLPMNSCGKPISCLNTLLLLDKRILSRSETVWLVKIMLNLCIPFFEDCAS